MANCRFALGHFVIATTTTKVSPYQTMKSLHKASQPFCVDLKKKNLCKLLCRLVSFYIRIKQIIVLKLEFFKSPSYKDDFDELCKFNTIEIMKILKVYSRQIRLIPVTRRKFTDSIQKNSVLALTTLTVCWPIRTKHSRYHNFSFMQIKNYNMICGPNNSEIIFRHKFDKIMTGDNHEQSPMDLGYASADDIVRMLDKHREDNAEFVEV